MASEKKSDSHANAGKPKKRKYLPHGKQVRKGAYPLRPGVQGFLITCDGGRERQAANEAINLLDNFYEELMDKQVCGSKDLSLPPKPTNKVIKFEYSDSSESDDDSSPACEAPSIDKNEDKNGDLLGKRQRINSYSEELANDDKQENAQKDLPVKKQCKDTKPTESECVKAEEKPVDEQKDLPVKEQCKGAKSTESECVKAEEKPIDEQIEDELRELRDRNKRHFVNLDSGCNGVIFIQMHRRTGDPSPAEIVEHMMNLAASTKKHMSRFILRILPSEISCYASEMEISRAIKPLISEHFPAEASTVHKFAVLYEARANTGVDRKTIIDAVAKSVPEPHKVDLNNPEKTIIVQIAKTVCLIGVAKRYKELSKYNLRQLTSPQTAEK